MQQPEMAAEVRACVMQAFDGLDRGVALTLGKLERPRRYEPDRAARALDVLVAQLAGYAIGLVGASVAGALGRTATAETRAAVRAELERMAIEPPPRRPPSRVDLDHELGPRRLVTPSDLGALLRERLALARADAAVVVARLVAAALCSAPHERASFACALAALHRDDLVPYRFGERIAAGWRATCDALALGRVPTQPPQLVAPAPEVVDNYCWMRIR